MRAHSSVDYDAIAHLYDSQPYRGKVADPELVTFMAQRAFAERPSILDIACGTGSQLVANCSIVPNARLVGLDRSFGMLRQARLKVRDIAWIQADGAMLPFQPESFDFITCQFGFHHVPDKAGMLRAVFQTLRCDGRFVMRNLCPQENPDWLYYDYFQEALAIDLADFWPPETIVATMEAIGFATVTVELEHLRFEQDLRVWLDTVRRRDTNSQLMAISDRAYEAGVHRLEREVADRAAPKVRADHLCLITIRGNKKDR
ncbi:MAG: methyltransferase domain-containing protein [Alphaproteobacteria bacterium]|nr:methyltransferase domain-containing protein [Alphaproteobacteria bacterium]